MIKLQFKLPQALISRVLPEGQYFMLPLFSKKGLIDWWTFIRYGSLNFRLGIRCGPLSKASPASVNTSLRVVTSMCTCLCWVSPSPGCWILCGPGDPLCWSSFYRTKRACWGIWVGVEDLFLRGANFCQEFPWFPCCSCDKE